MVLRSTRTAVPVSINRPLSHEAIMKENQEDDSSLEVRAHAFYDVEVDELGHVDDVPGSALRSEGEAGPTVGSTVTVLLGEMSARGVVVAGPHRGRAATPSPQSYDGEDGVEGSRSRLRSRSPALSAHSGLSGASGSLDEARALAKEARVLEELRVLSMARGHLLAEENRIRKSREELKAAARAAEEV